MSPLEDKIRDTLRSEAARLGEIRPLRLPPGAATHELRAVPRAPRVRRLRAWAAPAAAAAVVVLVAGTLVTLKALRNEPAAPLASSTPVASSSPIAGLSSAAGGTPRYYVALGWARIPDSYAIVVGDEQTGKTLATYPLPEGGALYSGATSGAADDRTFVVSAAPSNGAAGSPAWYLVRIFPGAADPVRITKLPIKFPAGEGVQGIALSGDGTELAVVSMPNNASFSAGVPLTLQTYAVAIGRLQHSWPAGVRATTGNLFPIADLSWVGDSTVGFAVTYAPEVSEEVRTLDISKTGASLLADSRLVWSQHVAPAPHGTRNSPHACDTPILTGNGQAVVCGNSTYSASDKRWSALWLAYPLATPTRPHVIGGITEPRDVFGFNGPISVDWTNPSGTEMIGSWNPEVKVVSHREPATKVTNDEGAIGSGKVKPFPYVLDPLVSW
jgi:hypothetical protein